MTTTAFNLVDRHVPAIFTTTDGSRIKKFFNYASTIEINGSPFQFYGKVRFAGEKRFYFEDNQGGTTGLRIHAAHRKIEDFDNIAERIQWFNAGVAEYRVYENRGEGKAPRLLRTYIFENHPDFED